MDHTIVVENLCKRYGDVQAVDDLSFTVGSGEFFGILGPNGAGKTTTLEIVEGLRDADSGTVSLLGESPWPRKPALLNRIGVQLQASSFFELMTAREQIHTFAQMYGVPNSRADAMLETVGLVDKADTRAEQLSGGQAQRLSIACALVHDPEVVFLDEPTSGLDPQARRNLWDVLRAINDEGRTVVLTTHYLDEAEVLCDRVAIVDHGRLLELGSPAELVRGLDSPVHIGIESGVLTAADAAALADDAEVSDDEVSLTIATRQPATVLAALADRDALRGLQVRGATLEDVFLHLTGREYRE
ncbi:MAG: ABC transporter ATP-binding protein [Sporichthyaceae bacterium]|nr:ABC transporter ATP-binding protein [Sporichthyaceae bacterium]